MDDKWSKKFNNLQYVVTSLGKPYKNEGRIFGHFQAGLWLNEDKPIVFLDDNKLNRISDNA